jgi:hypothetical protein|tara:strand:+ start:744 stop:1247 length:504 start_codon:yes stop_codon:yes gene_type:complete
MANPDTPNGFSPHGTIERLQSYEVDASATVIYFNDVVMMENDGNVAAATAGNEDLMGSAADYSAGSTAARIGVYDHPDQNFSAQDNAGGTPAQSYIGNDMDHEANAPGTTGLLRSGHELDASTVAATQGGFRLMRLVRNPDLSTADNARWVCKINNAEHHLLTAAGI